ncbi:ABC transporter substrate-binding protein [Actinokineospora iranica]|uniref:Iron complex transport system substrate-binding protein n=1 Tax=Actinokineospora iranica TaxID=1271860 RepID=A0A1G6U6M0_9PSEU|nr:ABC transporter substrate-binding protein [Actinokineospora iranica]SDD36969.1 iron complex transport system substrate-binding protein [Actinokineospora iranica]
MAPVRTYRAVESARPPVRSWRRLRAAAATVLLTLSACGSPAAQDNPVGETVRNCGIEVPATPPARIVATFHNAIEMVYALGADDRLVGASYLDNPILPEFAGRFRPDEREPAYYPTDTPSREEFLRLDPDFVLSGFTGTFTTEGLGTRAELTDLGIGSYLFSQYCPTADGQGQTSLAANDTTLESVYRDITDLGRILGKPDEATALVARMRATVAEAANALGGVAERPRVAMINRPGNGDIRVFGAGDVATSIIEAAGGDQVFDDINGRMTRIGVEELIKRAPQVILVPACCGADVGPEGANKVIEELRKDPAVANVPAVRDNRVHAITFAEISPGVRNADAVAAIARMLHPERF